ncbi:hypothetical protein GGR51DRAFT_516235 [Nemania sp. FL0031]|nr:hypothetical protein GGR51DRAFT_516235 [Nemania sp. FL0031]
MSALPPENPDQGGFSPRRPGESSTSGEHSSERAAIISSIEHDDGEAPPSRNGTTSPGESERQESQGLNVTDHESVRRVFKSILPQAPPGGFHYNSPVSVAGTEQDPATDGVPTNGGQANGTHGLNGGNRENGLNGTKSVSGESHEGNNPEASSSADSSPRSHTSRRSHTSSSPGPKNPPDQGGAAGPGSGPAGSNTGQSNGTGDRGHSPGTSAPPNQGSQDHNNGQSGGSTTEAQELGNEGNNGPGQNVAASEHAQAPARQEQNTSHNQQTSRGSSSFDETFDRDSEVTTTPFNINHNGSQQPGHISSPSIQPGHHPPEPQTFTLAGQTLQVAEPARPPSASSSLNPIAPVFMPRPQQFTLPKWQPDSEVTHCPICSMRFGLFFRKHHCRKCGRVVCDRCSPHSITIPHQYIVRPPGDLGPVSQYAYPGVERGIADFTSIGGGERVRLCNPCVPDPNTAPPQAQQPPRPVVVDGRTTRPPSNSLGNYSTNAGPSLHRVQLPAHNSSHSRSQSASTSVGRGQEYLSFIPYASTSSQYPPSNSAYLSQQLPHRRVSSTLPRYQQHFVEQFGAPGPVAPFSALNRPLPQTPSPEPEVPEEDICPVCHRELPSRTLPNSEALREIHINSCITSHSNYGSSQTNTTAPGNHGTPPPRTIRRTRMFPYVATEKDCAHETECTICLEEFEVGDHMARLECFCRFHRACIDSWFVHHPGRCPVHQHDSYGY